MSKGDALHYAVLKKFGDKLIYETGSKEVLYKQFVNSIEEGQLVHVFFEAVADDGSPKQMAKINACIRELAKEAGSSFEDMKKEVKRKSGLYISQTDEYMSFTTCSSTDLSLVIQTLIEVGELLGVNCRD
jgi:hypothetical protein